MVTPSVFVMARLACGVSVSVSVALLFAGTASVTPPGAVTVAVLLSDPVADAEMVAVTVKVTEPPAGRLTEALIFPEPDAGAVAPNFFADGRSHFFQKAHTVFDGATICVCAQVGVST